MFGYIVPDVTKLDEDQIEMYRSYYCGLCHTLKRKYSSLTRLTLNNDMTFLIALLNGLYEPDYEFHENRCIVHPLHKHLERISPYTYYAAKMTIVLSYYKAMDDVEDDGKHYLVMKYLKTYFDQVEQEYPDKVRIIRDSLKDLSQSEKQGVNDLDYMCNTFGHILGVVFRYDDPLWGDDLYQLGYHLGQFVYLLDAYDDLEEDEKKGHYNPLSFYAEREDFDEFVRKILEMYISEATMCFESLPIFRNRDILRHVLYYSIWAKFEMKKQGEADESV